MSEENKNINYQNEEIDLKKLFVSIGEWFVNVWFWILGLIILIRNLTIKYKYLFLASIILGTAISYYKTTSSQPYYQGSFLVKSMYMNKSVAGNIVDNLNNMSGEDLSKALDLDTAISNQILSFSYTVEATESEQIEFETVRQKLAVSNFDRAYKVVVENYIKDQLISFVFNVNVKDNSVLKDVIEGASNYCRGFDYIKKRIDVNNRNLELKKKKLQAESSKLDSLKTFIVKNIEAMGDRASQGSNNVILADDVNANPLNVFDQDLKFYDQELAIDKQLALQEDFEVFDGSYLQASPASPSLLDNLKIWLLYAIGASYGIIFIIQVNKYLNKVEKDQMTKE